MRTTGFRSVVLYILLAVFIGGIGYLLVNLALNGDKWVAQPYNGHIYAEDATADTGKITDRNNLLLADSEGGKRLYSDNSSVRQALLHTVGDSSGYIGTSVQTQLRSKLIGYNFFTGLNRTPMAALGANDLKLTVDARLSAAAFEGLNGKDGAVMLYNYKTGEVLCKVSAPGYDPANVPEDLMENPQYEGVLVDNTLSGAFVPGSIFKIVTAASAMENLSDWESLTYDCQESVEIGEGVITCLDYHGQVDMAEAFGQSCNVYFALLAEKLGAKKLQATADEMGFNQSFSFQDFSTAKSVVDLKGASDLQLGWAAVGQHTLMANPTHMLVLMSAIAQGGNITPPRLTEKGIFSAFEGDKSLMSASVATNLQRLMRSNVADYYGDWIFPDMAVCAKTGTAEVGRDKEPTSWIVGFSQNTDTPYAFVVAVVEGGSGISCAGNLAADLMAIACA